MYKKGVEFTCPECPFTTDTEKKLWGHNRLVHSQVTFQCEKCGKNFNKKENMEKHQVIHANKMFDCLVCKAQKNT